MPLPAAIATTVAAGQAAEVTAEMAPLLAGAAERYGRTYAEYSDAAQKELLCNFNGLYPKPFELDAGRRAPSGAVVTSSKAPAGLSSYLAK